MLRIMKSSGQVYSRGGGEGKGELGRLEFKVERKEKDGEKILEISFVDFGNYGKNRWDATAVISEKNLEEMIARLVAVQAGESKCTLRSFDSSREQQKVQEEPEKKPETKSKKKKKEKQEEQAPIEAVLSQEDSTESEQKTA